MNVKGFKVRDLKAGQVIINLGVLQRLKKVSGEGADATFELIFVGSSNTAHLRGNRLMFVEADYALPRRDQAQAVNGVTIE